MDNNSFYFQLLNQNESLNALSDETEYMIPQGENTFGDYIADVFRAPIAGVSRAVQGLLQLGVLPIDYATDSNFTSKLDSWFDSWVPDAKTGLGNVAQTLVQFGLPLGIASKVAPALKVLKGATTINRLDKMSGVGQKSLELVRRAGYYGAVGGVTDLAVSTTGRQQTIGETFGFDDPVDLDQLDGKERAAEALKQKFKFAAEGAVIGGAIPLLPVAGTLGAKFLGKAYTTKLGTIGKTPVSLQGGLATTFRLLDVPVQKASELIAGKGESSLIRSAVIGSGKLFDKPLKSVPDASTWKFYDTKDSLGILKRFDQFKNYFTSSGILSPTLKAEGDKVAATLESEIKKIARINKRIDSIFYDTARGLKREVYDEITNSGVSRNIMDAVQTEKNKVFDYITATEKSKALKALDKVNPAVRKYAKELKQILKESNTRYGNMLFDAGLDKKKRFKLLAGELKNNADNFFKQRFAAFNNDKFKFDLGYDTKLLKKTGEYKFNAKVTQDAFDELKKIIKANRNDLRDVFKSKPGAARNKAIDDAAFNRLNSIKMATINAGRDVNRFFSGISTIIKKDLNKLQPGETFPDAIKRFLSTPKGQKVEIKDYTTAMLDNIIYNNKQVYKKNYFDLVESEWLKNGVVFRSLEDGASKGIDPTRLQSIKPKAVDGIKPTDLAFESSLFKNGYYSLPEINNAILSTRTQFDNFFDNDWYKAIMQFKAGGQIAKTIFSPMTQIRNVTTASFFPLASGLFGKRSSLADAFKLVADDIFTSAKTDINVLNKEIDDLVQRGVIDQNIQVNEIREILQRARGGRISFESFMKNPVVQKFVDVYQGGDNVWKVYSDKFYRSALEDAFGNPQATPQKVLDQVKDWYKTVAKTDFIERSGVTGKLKTADEALKEVSAYLVTNTIPTYSKVPRAIQELRKLPLGNFIAFPAEIIRTGSNLLSIGARELTSTNPFIRQMGARRLIGTSAVFGGIGSIVSNTAGYVTGVTEEIMDRAQRSFVPIYERNATLIPLTAPDENGSFKYFNFSYSNPYDTLFRPVNAVINAFGNGNLKQQNVDTIVFNALFGTPQNPGAITEFLSPFITESIGTERIADVTLRNGKTNQGKIIYDPRADDLGVIISKSLNHIIGGLEPGGYTSARRIWQGATGTFTDSGTARNTKDEAVALLSGIRVQEVKPLNSMPFIVTSFRKDNNALARKFARDTYSAAKTPENQLASYRDYVKKSFISQQNFATILNDAQELGISRIELRKILNDRLTKSSTNNLLTGRFKVPGYSKDAFDSLIKRLESENPVAASIFKDNVRTLTRNFDRIKRRLRFLTLDQSAEEVDDTVNQLFSDPTIEIRELPTRVTTFEEDIPEQKVELPADPNLANAPSSQIIAQTKKPITLTELERSPIFSLLRNRGIA